MPSHLAAIRVLLAQIDFDDDTFSLLPWSETALPDSLTRSIARAGLLHPPLLQARQGAGYRVIAGRRRLQAVRDNLKSVSCTCLVLPAEAPDLEGLALSLEDTLALRPLSPLERVIFLRKAGRHLDAGQLAGHYFPLLGLAPGTDLQEMLRLLQLEEPLQRALHAGRLEEKVARELGGMPFIDRWSLFEVIELLGMSRDDQPRLVASCRHEAQRAKRSILDLLATPAAKEILEDVADDPARKTAKLLEWLVPSPSGRGPG